MTMFLLSAVLCMCTAYLVSSGPVGLRLCHVLCDRDCSCSFSSYDSEHMFCDFIFNSSLPSKWNGKTCTSNTCRVVNTRRGDTRCVETNQPNSTKGNDKMVWTRVTIDPLEPTKKPASGSSSPIILTTQTKVTNEPVKARERTGKVKKGYLYLKNKQQVTEESAAVKRELVEEIFKFTHNPVDLDRIPFKLRKKLAATVIKEGVLPTEETTEASRPTGNTTPVNYDSLKLPRDPALESGKRANTSPQVYKATLRDTRMPAHFTMTPQQLANKPTQVTNKLVKPTRLSAKHSGKRPIHHKLWWYTKLRLYDRWNSIYTSARIPIRGSVKFKLKYITFLQLKGKRRKFCELYVTVKVYRKARQAYIQCQDCLSQNRSKVALKNFLTLLYVKLTWVNDRVFVWVMEEEYQKTFSNIIFITPSSFTDFLVSDKSRFDYVEVAKTIQTRKTDFFLI